MPSFGTISITSAMVAECFFYGGRVLRVEPYVKPSTTTSKVVDDNRYLKTGKITTETFRAE
jgi:hypothetical protein